MSNWHPWLDHKTDAPVAELNIPGPPCKGCRFWAPRRWYYENGKEAGGYIGVRLCWAEKMQFDFSCYVSRETVTQKPDGGA